MKDKEFRLDFFIAIAALLVSAASAAALFYQTRVIGDQYAATIWPYLSASGSLGPRGFSVTVVNDGLGPALVQSAQLAVDGKPASGWSQYIDALLKEPEVRTFFATKRADFLAGRPVDGSMMFGPIGPGTTIRAGDALTLMKIDFANAPTIAIIRHTILLKLCYCSLNKSCWTLVANYTKSAPEVTKPIAACATDTSIAPMAFMYPSAPRRRK